jgi:hypothetical protein
MLMFILGVALFSSYLGIRRLLNMPESSLLYSAHMVIMVALNFMAQLAFVWLYWEIRRSSLSVSWSGFVIGLTANLVILLVGCLDLYVVLGARRREVGGTAEDEADQKRNRHRGRTPTAIEEEIYRNYLAQGNTAWAFGSEPVDTLSTFYPVPYLPGKDDWLMLRRPWRIAMEMRRSGYDGYLTIGVDLYGDIVLGRSRNKRVGRITLDLSYYGARRLGVSRNHLLLRTTSEAIYAMDLGSSHGTKIDEESIAPFTALKIHDGCEISLGNRMILRIFVVSGPRDARRSVSD